MADSQMNRRYSFHPPSCIDECQGMGEHSRTSKITRIATHTILDVGMLTLPSPTVVHQVFKHIAGEFCEALPLIVTVMQAKSNDTLLACKRVSVDYCSYV